MMALFSSGTPSNLLGRRKYLAIADGTPESRLALRFAALAAKRRRRRLLILMVGEIGDSQHWLGVEELMRAETREEAQSLLDRLAREIAAYARITPETAFREGDLVEEVQTLLEADPQIAALVLAGAAEGAPGPLVSAFATGAPGLQMPVIVIPGDLPERELRAMA